MSAHEVWPLLSDFEGWRRCSRPRWLAVGSATLFILLVGTAVTWSFVRSSAEAALTLTQHTLVERSIRTEKLITERFAASEAILYASAGFIDNAWPLTREEWHRFVRPLLQSYVSPGVQGFGFAGVIRKVSPWQVEAIADEPLAESTSAPSGHVRTAILYLEPENTRNKRAIGFDMASDPIRWAAMSRARDEGRAALSRRVTLVQEIDSAAQPGFLLYVPVYERGLAASTVDERRHALVGYVYSPFRAVDFLDEVFEGEEQDVRIEVYDGRQPLSGTEMYNRGLASSQVSSAMYVLRHIAVGGHEWALRVTATPLLLRQSQRIPSWTILSIGAGTTLLLGGLVFTMARSRQMLRERLDVDERLLERERDAAVMLENSLEAFIVINGRDEILEWNKQAAATFGWSKEEVVGRCLADLLVPERMRAAHVNAVFNFHGREHSILDRRIEMPAMRRDGDEIYIALSVASVARRGETVFFASLRDVTARRLQEAQVRQLNATLEHRVSERTQELEAAHRQLESAYRDLEAFSRSVSHDLRAPLRTIKGYTSLLAEDLGSALTPKVQHDMDAIVQTAQRMDAIIDSLLKLASVTQRELKPEAISLGDLAQQVLAEINPAANVTIDLRREELGRVYADPGLLSLALRNLLSNAVKFSQQREQPKISIGAIERDGERICYVRDNGAGFDPKYASRLFGAFQRLHSEREFEGTGLGLTIVKSAIEKNGGRIWGESAVGCGATFYFVLPACLPETRGQHLK